jgi:hypothetical protein
MVHRGKAHGSIGAAAAAAASSLQLSSRTLRRCIGAYLGSENINNAAAARLAAGQPNGKHRWSAPLPGSLTPAFPPVGPSFPSFLFELVSRLP